MQKPKGCRCGGLYKKSSSQAQAHRDGSRYFECNQCHARIEQTANGYEFRDAAPPVVAGPPPPPPPTPVLPPPRRFW